MWKLWQKLKCFFGFHEYSIWHIGDDCMFTKACGKVCDRCGKYEVSTSEVRVIVSEAIREGKQREYSRLVPYAKGLEEILRLYPDAPRKFGWTKEE